MKGRRWLRILNYGGHDGNQRIDIPVVIGDRGVRWLPAPPQRMKGFVMRLDEFVDLPIDDSIIIYAIVANFAPEEFPADLRTIELR